MFLLRFYVFFMRFFARFYVFFTCFLRAFRRLFDDFSPLELSCAIDVLHIGAHGFVCRLSILFGFGVLPHSSDCKRAVLDVARNRRARRDKRMIAHN